MFSHGLEHVFLTWGRRKSYNGAMNATPQELFRQNARSLPPPMTAGEAERLRMEDRIKRGDDVAELGAGADLSQTAKISLEEHGAGGGNFVFGDSFVDENGDGVDDRRQDPSYVRRSSGSSYQTAIRQTLDYTIAAIDRQLDKTRQDIALTQQELDQIDAWLSDIKRERAELAPKIDAQRKVVENQKLAVENAQVAVDDQAAKVEAQTKVVEQKQTEVKIQEGVVAQKTVEERQAAESLTIAKETTIVKAEEKVAADQKVDTLKSDYKTQTKDTIGYTNKDGNRASIFKKTAPDGTEILVTEGGSSLSEQEMAALREANKNADGTVPADSDLLARAKTYDAAKHETSALDYLQADNSAVYAGTALKTAQKEEQKAQTVWETAAESLKVETEKLDTLNKELKTEQDKLAEEQKLLAEKQQKLAEEKGKLVGDEAKLKELEQRDAELKAQQEKLEAQKQELTAKLEKLQQDEKKLEAAKTKLSDPDFQKDLAEGKISKEQFLKEVNDLPLPESEKTKIRAQIESAGPAPAPEKSSGPTAIAATGEKASMGSAPSPTAQALATKASESGSSISFSGSAFKDDNVAQNAFTAAASKDAPKTPEVAAAAPKTPDEDLKDKPLVVATAPTAPTPA